MKILALGTSNNSTSINRCLAQYAANLVQGASVETVNISDYELPLFSDDREEQLGQPQLAADFYSKISQADALVISFVEHNGSYTAAYKNLFDWASRISKDVYQDKPTVFLSTSPGPGGAKSVLKSAVESASFFGADLVASLSVPNFHENFDTDKNEITNEVILQQLSSAMKDLKTKVQISANSLNTASVAR